MSDNIFSKHFEILFAFFPEDMLWYFMHIVSNGDNLHEMSNPVFWERIRKLSFIFRMLN